ncbi:hypothetical protein B0H10DRAFT_1966010 [Mycena sp. CBHHK59/15]|nr:hypothetical protein B0H10DRAFT_1966010 [Mycena sp. CBHHK59/15]
MAQTPAEVEAAQLKQTLLDMSKSLATLTAEIAKRPAASALEQLVGLPANPLAFPPGANGTYPVLVTPLLHPHLLPDVIAQIGKLEFPPANLGRLLKTVSVTPPAALHLVLGPNGEAQFVPSTPVSGATALLREVPDILTFVEAWMIFMSVLQNQQLALPIAQALTAHLNNIIVVARVYPWASVLDYHVAFMQARALDPYFNPINWTKSDPHLHTQLLLTPSLVSPSLAPLPPTTPSSGPAPVVKAAQTCYAYNGAGCGGASVGCLRRHICRACGGPHAAYLCRTLLPADAMAPSAA